jgi:hypothetical protein
VLTAANPNKEPLSDPLADAPVGMLNPGMPCAVIRFYGRVLVVMPQPGAGLGIMNPNQRLLQYDILGCMGGKLTHHDGPYVMQSGTRCIDADPHFCPRWVNGIPFGSQGIASLGYLNEAVVGSQPNVMFHSVRYLEDRMMCFVVCPEIGPWTWLETCYGSFQCYDRGKHGYRHVCSEIGCNPLRALLKNFVCNHRILHEFKYPDVLTLV